VGTGEAKVIVTTLCGHGHFDMASYEKFLTGGLEVGWCAPAVMTLGQPRGGGDRQTE
jgi:hypothetical protein